MRGALARAAIARATNDTKTAIRLYNRVLDENSHLMPEALPDLIEIHREQGTLDKLNRDLEALTGKTPKAKNQIAYSAIVSDLGGLDVIDRCVENYIVNEPTLTEFIDVQQFAKEDEAGKRAAIAKIRHGLNKLAGMTPRYQCKECGFSSQQLLWQCPSCKDWETQRPFASVQFDSLLQRNGIIDY
jgi:lipopolysaccharide biosynthesis regulator YciM